MKGEKLNHYSRLKDGIGRMVVGDNDVRKILKEYFEDLYNVATEVRVTLNIYGSDRVKMSNYFGLEPISAT